ncbi:MAG: tetratricopeptide repeat protein [Opitutaceae bacterium]|nr:tetratricopeptide repeat protein [Opitutaceae bacterium]
MQKSGPTTRSAVVADLGQPAWRAILVFVALLAVGLGVAYHNSFSVPFVFDDQGSIEDNPTLGSFATALVPPRDSGVTVSGRPLLNLSLAVNMRLGGLDVRGYHAVNLAIHFLAALTLFGVVRRTLQWPIFSEGLRREASLVAGGATLFWALHPMQTESVTYIVQRAESLVGLLFLFTVYAFIRAAATPSRAWAAAAVVTCYLGMTAKEVMAAAPLVLVLYDRTFVSGTFREAWRRHGRLHLFFASGWLILLALVIASGSRGSTVGYGAVTWLDYVLTQGPGITTYLLRAIVPVHLVFDYGAVLDRRWLIVLSGLAVVASIVVATGVLLQRKPRAGFLGAWFLLILAPTSSVIPVVSQTLAEHRMYLPLAAVAVAVALAARHFLGRRAWPILGAIAVLFCAGTVDRNHDYRSPLSIWEDTVKKTPANARALNNYGVFLREAGRSEEAMVQMARALELAPAYALVHSNLGVTLVRHALGISQTGDDVEVGSMRQARAERVAREPDRARVVEKGLGHLRQAIEIEPSNARFWSNHATALFECGRATEAVEKFERAIALEPASSVHHFNLANTLAELGRLEDAARHYEIALQMFPKQPDVLVNYAILLRWQERWPESLARLEAARALSPKMARVRSNLGVTLLAMGRTDEGLAELTRALELDPDLPQARYHLGFTLGQRGRVDEAIGHFEALLRIAPPTAELLSNLGVLQAQAGRIEQAVALTQQAIALDPGYEPARDNLARLTEFLRGASAPAQP